MKNYCYQKRAVVFYIPIFTDEEGGLVPSPFLSNIVPIVLLLFITVGTTYGVTVKMIKSQNDVVTYMAESIKGMSGYIVLIFAENEAVRIFNIESKQTLCKKTLA